AYGVHAGIACKEARWLLAVVGRAAETNLLLAEDYLARNPVGNQGAPGPGAPPAAAARLRTALQSRKGLKRPQTARPERGQSRFPIDSRMRRRGGLAHDELGRKDRPLVLGRRRTFILDLVHQPPSRQPSLFLLGLRHGRQRWGRTWRSRAIVEPDHRELARDGNARLDRAIERAKREDVAHGENCRRRVRCTEQVDGGLASRFRCI